MALKRTLVQEEYLMISTGSDPATGYLSFYPKSDGNFYKRTSAGVERRLLTSDDSFWTASGNNIYNANAGNVGIGKTNPTAKLDVNGNIRAVSIDLIKPALNSVNVQLNTPTVEEMALIHGVMNNKLRFRPPVLQEQSSDGAEWVTSSRATENQLADLMIGQGQGSNIIAIPISSVGQQNHYRLTWDYFGHYMYLDAVYIYGVFYNNVSIKIEGLLRSTEEWTTITESTVTGAPRHIYIPHQTLILHPSQYYSKARITFSVFSSTTTNNVTLHQIEWLGTYPAGRRNVETYDRDKNVTFPNQIIGQSFKSLVPTGTAPFVIASTTVNTNLNADLLDGYHASDFQLAITNPITGTGTANYIPKFTSASQLGNSVIYETGGKIGIDTTTPDYTLDVIGTIGVTGGVNNRKTVLTANGLGLYTPTYGGYAMSISINKASDGALLGSLAGAYGSPDTLAYLYYGGDSYLNAAMYILPNKNIGIGTTAPSVALDVNGQIQSRSATGTAPFVIASTTLVSKLNADLLDGHHASDFQLALTNPVTGTGTTNYIPKFTAANQLGDSIIYETGGGIGLLNVEGAINAGENYIAAGDLYLTNGSTPEVMFRRYLLSGSNYVYLTSGYILGEVGFYASDASPNDYLKSAAIVAKADGHHAEKNFPTLMEFHTCPSGAVDGKLRMTINSEGHVSVNKGMTVNSEYENSYFVVNGAGSSSAPQALFVANNRVSINHSGGAGDSSFNVNGAISVKSRYITTTDQTLGEEYMVYMNVSSLTSLYCPSASTSMDRMYFVANAGANAVTLRVPSGNYLNGVLNGTYTIQSQGLTIVHQGRAIGSLNWYAYELRVLC